MKQRRVDEAGDQRDIAEMQNAFEEAFRDRTLASDAVEEGAIFVRRDRAEQRIVLRLAEQHLLCRCFRRASSTSGPLMDSGKTSASPAASCVKDVTTFARVSNQLGATFRLIHTRVDSPSR